MLHDSIFAAPCNSILDAEQQLVATLRPQCYGPIRLNNLYRMRINFFFSRSRFCVHKMADFQRAILLAPDYCGREFPAVTGSANCFFQQSLQKKLILRLKMDYKGDERFWRTHLIENVTNMKIHISMLWNIYPCSAHYACSS